jgi:hypothetical protein
MGGKTLAKTDEAKGWIETQAWPFLKKESVPVLWAIYAAVCFVAATGFNLDINDEQAVRLISFKNESSNFYKDDRDNKLSIEPGPEGSTTVVVHPYEMRLINAPGIKRYSYFMPIAFVVAIAFWALLRFAHSFPEAWSAAFILLFSVLALEAPGRQFWYRSDSTIVATSLAYAALLAMIYATQGFCKRFDLGKNPELSREKAAIKLYSLLLQAGFVVFLAICITLMFDISKGTVEEYKLAGVINARTQELTETRVSIHATIISFGVLAGILARLLASLVRIVRSSSSAPEQIDRSKLSPRMNRIVDELTKEQQDATKESQQLGEAIKAVRPG